jgi:AmmeMemoRadiSam system protein B/AmmeMemoRadiSam system protein A
MTVREPAVAGAFYPADAEELHALILDCLPAPHPAGGPPLLALVAPHAGYRYSGSVAGQAYTHLSGHTFDTVVVVAPSHRVPFRGISIWPQGAFRTPLGLVKVDEPRCGRILRSSADVQVLPEAHRTEHALEVQLPFLQTVLEPGWKLVPLIMGTQDPDTAQELGEAIDLVRRSCKTLTVASSDLSHYHPARRAEVMDRKVVRRLLDVDSEGLWAEVEAHRVEACGIGPILVALSLAQKAGIRRGRLFKYAHSGHITGDHSHVVGYAAVGWEMPNQEQREEVRPVGVDLGLKEAEKQVLKEIARTTIACRLGNKPLPQFQGITDTLQEPRGAFVTLEKNHRLRGCIGFIHATKPLWKTVQEMAESAAFRDPRFTPLTKEEWPAVEVEISVLTPMQEIKDPSRIEVGKHGLYIVKGPYRGLLLPQVATDYGWDRETFLAQTCTKAGLPIEAWKDPDTTIYVFAADVF